MTPFSVSGLLIAITCFSLVVVVYCRAPRSFTRDLVALFNLCVGVWGLGIVCAALTRSPVASLWGWRLAHTGGIALGAVFFHLSHVLTESAQKRKVLASYVFGLVFILLYVCGPAASRIQALVDRALFKATPVELAEQRDHLLLEVRRSEQMKAVGMLAAGLAHEIKNPLAAIKTFTESLNERYDDPAFRVKFQRIVGGEVERINLHFPLAV